MESQAHPKVQGPLHVLPEVCVLSVSPTGGLLRPDSGPLGMNVVCCVGRKEQLWDTGTPPPDYRVSAGDKGSPGGRLGLLRQAVTSCSRMEES